MTSNQCGVLFSDIDLRSFVYHIVHGHPEFAVLAILVMRSGELKKKRSFVLAMKAAHGI